MQDILLPKNSIQIIRGTSKVLRLTVVDSCGDPVNLTGATIIMTVKNRVEDRNNIFQKTTANSAQITITDPFGGLAEIFILPADTQGKDVKQYVFDVMVILSPSGARYDVVGPAIFDIQPSVTDWPIT